ncbi:MAG: CvpA family protein [Holosporaceae bacterium]|jgi:membrane protein required for colicin V production|nr:CvpA family protein [Holosporaceae bacterium]
MNSSEFFNFLDYIYIALMFSSTMAGFIRGFIKDFFSTCAWFGSGFIAVFVSPYLIPSIYERIPNMTIARCVTIGISYLIALIIFLLIISSISQNVRRGVLSGVDRAVGVLFGLFRGIGILISICTLMIIFEIPRDKYEAVKNSKLSVILFDISELLIPQMVELGLLDKAKPVLIEKGKAIENLSLLDKFKKKISSKKEIKEPKKTEKLISRPIVVEKKKVIMEPTKEERKPFKDRFVFLQKIKKFLSELLARQRVEPERVKVSSPRIIKRTDRPRYGSMSLMEARARRRAQRKAEKLKKEIEKLLDRENP